MLKKTISNFFSLILILLLSGSKIVFGQISGSIGTEDYTSIARVTSTAEGKNIAFTNPSNGSAWTIFSGVFNGTISSQVKKFYCIDIQNSLAYNEDYWDEGKTSSHVTHILNNYYPHNNSYSGMLSDINQEAAAIQMAIWHFTDNADVNTITNDNVVKTRALQIIADATANHNNVVPINTVLIVRPSNSYQVGTPLQFYVFVFDINGVPVSNKTINLSTTLGSLSVNSVITDANGRGGPITLTHNSVGVSIISATTSAIIPQGTRYVHKLSPGTKQKLVLATPVLDTKQVTDTIHWVLPAVCDLSGHLTFTQGGWGSPSNSGPGIIRDMYFNSVFPTGLTVGGNFILNLTSASAVKNFLPQGGTAGAFNQNYTNSTSTSAGVLAGQIVALKLNVHYNLAGYLGNNPIPLRDLIITSGPFIGWSVNQFLAFAEQAIGGGALNGFTFSQINDAATAINENFNGTNTNNGFLDCAQNVFGSIGDRVWNDVNQNGIQDAGEAGISNVTVKLFDCSNNLISTTVTDANGNYLFSNVPTGSYYVKFELPTGYVFSPKDQGSDDTKDSDADPTTGQTVCITLAPGQNNMTLDAGMYLPKGSIGDKVWNDVNQNGIQDAGEVGISNVTVKLFDCSNNLISTTVTDANGNYLFSNVPTGSYYVKFELPTGYVFSPKDQGNDDTKDSDADPLTGKTVCITLAPGQNNMTLDAGMYLTPQTSDIRVIKTASVDSVLNNGTFSYTITVTNLGPNNATGVVITDLLPSGVEYQTHNASQGSYNSSTGIWNVGNLNTSATATLTITVKANLASSSSTGIDLGIAKDYNVFVIQDYTAPSSDTEGRVAVGRNASFSNYSIGDQLPPNSGDVLVVGNNLTYTSGAIYNGNVVYGNWTNLPIYAVSILHGTLRKDTVINFVSAEAYLNTLSATLSSYTTNGTTQFQWGGLTLIGNHPVINVFQVNGSDLSVANNLQINIPSGSVAVVNINGTTISWTGGLTINGAMSNNVIYNFYQATNITIQGIDVQGSILAPKAAVNFVSGVQHGQMMCKSLQGMGQYNHRPFIGNIPLDPKIVNIATLTALDQIDPVTNNNSSSVTVIVKGVGGGSGGSGGGTGGGGSGGGSGNWQFLCNFTGGQIIQTMAYYNSKVYVGTIGGKIFCSTNNGTSWSLINPYMYVGFIWSIQFNSSGHIFVGTEQGVYKSTDNGSTWVATSLFGKDVRSIVIDGSGNIYAATWGFGIFKSSNGGLTWSAINNGITSLITTALTIGSSNTLFASTFLCGVFKSVDGGASWTQTTMNYNFVQTLASTSTGILFAGTYGDGLYRSTDNGTSWSKCTNGMTASFIYSITVNPSDRIFVSSWVNGVFMSNDGGNSWTSLGLFGFGATSVMFNPNSNLILVGTGDGSIYATSPATDVETKQETIPTEISLSQNYPNPFNPATRIDVNISVSGFYSLKIYNSLGEEISTLFSGYIEPGYYTFTFNASELPSGMYVYNLRSDNINIVRKMILMK